MGQQVRFRLRRGCKVSRQAVLLVNKPLLDQDTGILTFTVTQPRMPIIPDMDMDEVKQACYDGSKLDQQYLERIVAHNAEAINLEFRVEFPSAGSFFIQIEYFDANIGAVNFTQPIYINVEPYMLLREQRVRCKQLSIQTVLSRCLGPLDRWESVLSNTSQLCYNAVHYTPIQKYGQSNSHYSLLDQTLIDDQYFGKEACKYSREERLRILKQTINHLREEYGLLGIIDIVLNHTANNSQWLLEHPDSAYNTDDCPHLNSAYLFDKALADFSDDYAQKRNIPECPSAPLLNNEQDLRLLMSAIQNRVINRLNFQEFFSINLDKTLNNLRDFLKNLTKEKESTIKAKIDRKQWWNRGIDRFTIFKDKLTSNYGASRHGVVVDIEFLAVYVLMANNQNQNKCEEEVKAMIQKHNQEWNAKVTGFMKEALQCIEGTIRYFKLELCDNKITLEKKLLRRYFTELDNPQQSKVAHNGWIMNADPMEDFAMSGWHYLRRTINIWSDSVKLRYGKCPKDSPFLWEHMSTYVSDMALIFDGFRLDNAHSTPIHVCYYLLQVARTNNPNLFVMAELFTSSAEADAVFVQKLNLNGLVRELQNTYNARQLGDYFHQMTCREAVIGLIDQEFEDIQGQKYVFLMPKKPNDIIYDCTHDNPATVQKFKTGRIALSHIGVACMADQPIATTWGFDQLIPQNLNVVTENRLYSFGNQDNLYAIDNQDPNMHKLSFKKEHEGEKIHEQSIKSPEWTPERPKDFEYEFIYYNENASKIQIAGCFTNWKPIHDMSKESRDKWVLKLTLPILQTQDKYEFKFVVNQNNWQINSNLPQEKDKSGNVNNCIYMPGTSQTTQSPQLPINNQEYVFQDIKYARRRLNEIHYECAQNNAEIFLHQQSEEVIVIIRQLPLDHSENYDAYVSITRQCYFQEGGDYNYQTSIELPGLLSEIVFAGYLEFRPDSYNQWRDQNLIKGANAQFKVYKDLARFCKIERIKGQDCERLVFFQMPPSFTCIVKTKYPQYMKESVRTLNHLSSLSTEDLSKQLFNNFPLSLLNHLLFRCEPEEREISNGTRGTYGLQSTGTFVYAGLTSFMHILRQLKVSGDMGHELFNNMRQGDWYLDYAKDRLNFMAQEAQRINEYLNEFIFHVKRLNPTFKPKYGARVIEKLYNAAVYELINRRMKDNFVQSSDDFFIQKLALGTIQMYGRVPSASFYDHKDTLCAGLPHFSTGYMRCWGRDTFIALRGLFIATGLETEARDIFKFFARVTRHGLIPNLHDRGNSTRYNARDAVWFFLQAFKDFVNLSKEEGYSLLNENIEMHFRDNDQRVNSEKIQGKEQPRITQLGDLIQEILQAHASGIEYREWNAGAQIDSQMKNEGFNVKIWLDQETGFCFGGNSFNCGTWMDKMGSSEKTGNKGIPATPRDGAPIELVAMQYSVLRFMESLSDCSQISHKGVQLSNGHLWTYKEWADRVKQHFERCFYIPIKDKDDHQYVIEKKYVNRRGIYRDIFRATHTYTEYQLRPNLCIAMSYAPDLFDFEHARVCLLNVETILMEPGCMGIKTLDPSDKNYKGDYINSDDSQGWNYHQGPEWLWPVGFFLKAKIIFQKFDTKNDMIEDIMKWLLPHQKFIMLDNWEGLPELTNSHGKECYDSCRTQAWSLSTIFDAIRDLYYL